VPDGLELVKALHMSHAGLPVLIVSMHDEQLYAARALQAGARGYLTKDKAVETLASGIRQVARGGLFVSREVAATLAARTAAPGDGAGSLLSGLTDRELEVLQRLGEGRTTREVAELLHLSVKTIESHRANLKRKLDLRNAVELTRVAVLYEQGLLTP
jgi:Response regulator containing a CheY-like receiver domain and an HTH DNA-binding domain